MDEETANKIDANTEDTTPANRKEYMRELMRKKRAAERVRKELGDSRSGEEGGADAPIEIESAAVVNLTPTDRQFEEVRPGYYIFGKEVRERTCWKCSKKYETGLEMNKFCSPKCKNDWLTSAFGELKQKGN